jgi:hypothetical protein
MRTSGDGSFILLLSRGVFSIVHEAWNTHLSAAHVPLVRNSDPSRPKARERE